MGRAVGTTGNWDEAAMKPWLPLVDLLASKFKAKLPACVELDDLVQWGRFGLAVALEKFDPDRGIRFNTYAPRRIIGAMKDGLRDLDWVPRLERTRGNPTPDITSLSTPMDARPGFDRQASFGSLVEDTRSSRDSENVDAADQVKRLMSVLPEPHFTVVREYHLGEKTMREVGDGLGLSESRISQIHHAAMQILKAASKRDYIEPPQQERPMDPIESSVEFKPFLCKQHPDRRFDAKEAAREAGVTTAAIYYAAKKGVPCGPKQLEFYRDGESSQPRPANAKPSRMAPALKTDLPLRDIRIRVHAEMDEEIKAATEQIRQKYAAKFAAITTVEELMRAA